MFLLKGGLVNLVAALASIMLLVGSDNLPAFLADTADQWGVGGLFAGAIMLLAFWIGNVFLVGGITHGMLRLLGAKKKFSTTISVMSYSMSPALAFLGPPCIVLIGLGSQLEPWFSTFITAIALGACVWSGFIMLFGMIKQHGVGILRALLAASLGLVLTAGFWIVVVRVLTHYLVTLPAQELLAAYGN